MGSIFVITPFVTEKNAEVSGYSSRGGGTESILAMLAVYIVAIFLIVFFLIKIFKNEKVHSSVKMICGIISVTLVIIFLWMMGLLVVNLLFATGLLRMF
jgi:hypothetical protein